MGSGTLVMSQPKKTEYCTYGTIKVDVEVLSRARAAANLEEKSYQEWVSDVLNEASAKVVRREPIKRKPPPPHPKRNPPK